MIKIFDIKYTNYSDLSENSFIVYNKDNEYYYILDSSEKVKDVQSMPSYIKEDYYRYNSKILTLSFFNKTLEKYKVKFTLKPHFLGNKLETLINQFTEEEEDIIKTIKRDLSLKEIL